MRKPSTPASRPSILPSFGLRKQSFYRLIDLPQIDPLQEDLAVIRVDILKILVAFYCEALAPYRFDRIRHGHGQVGQFPDERKSSTTTKPSRW
jgi:hypothetical protein